jgi:Flp pilus assembly protein TadB
MIARMQERDTHKRILDALPDFVELVGILQSAGGSLNEVLASAAETIAEPLRTEVARLAAEYNITHDLEASLAHFTERTNMVETETLAAALGQLETTGQVRDLLEAQAYGLKQAAVFRIQRTTEQIKTNITFILLTALFNILALIGYPMLKMVTGAISTWN